MRMLFPLAIVLALTAGANAEDLKREASVGHGIICDTSDQTDRFVSLVNDGASADSAVETINSEADDEQACGEAVVAFTVDEEVTQKGAQHIAGTPVSIARITVLAISDDGEHWAPISPKVQYTVLPAKGLDV